MLEVGAAVGPGASAPVVARGGEVAERGRGGAVVVAEGAGGSSPKRSTMGAGVGAALAAAVARDSRGWAARPAGAAGGAAEAEVGVGFGVGSGAD